MNTSRPSPSTYVDNNKISHKDAEVNSEVINAIEKQFDILGMKIDLREGEFAIDSVRAST